MSKVFPNKGYFPFVLFLLIILTVAILGYSFQSMYKNNGISMGQPIQVNEHDLYKECSGYSFIVIVVVKIVQKMSMNVKYMMHGKNIFLR